jgi:hypothetical protein
MYSIQSESEINRELARAKFTRRTELQANGAVNMVRS